MKKIFTPIIVVLLLLMMVGVASAKPPDPKNYVALLRGANEVPARETPARGISVFHLKRDGTQLGYVLAVAKIDNVVAAHVHCGAPGVNGPVGATLFSGGTPGSGPVNGVLAKGTITAPDANNGCGWATLADVAAAMQSGNTYVNVHTNDGIPPTNTGPGDFPGGEIRGQVQAKSPHR